MKVSLIGKNVVTVFAICIFTAAVFSQNSNQHEDFDALIAKA